MTTRIDLNRLLQLIHIASIIPLSKGGSFVISIPNLSQFIEF
jgi:hypothetical protein